MADTTVYGIDLSHNNGTITWSKVKLSSPLISFAYIKATQGVGYKDPAVASHAAGAAGIAIKLGYYHFASLNDNVNVVKDATAEAHWFDSVLKTVPAAQLMPVLDIETNDKNLTPQQVQQWITAFLSTMNSLGHAHVMLYSYKPFFDTNLPAAHPFGNLPLWLAQYRPVATLPNGWSKLTLWQYSDAGAVSGITGNCDLNKCTPDFLSLPL